MVFGEKTPGVYNECMNHSLAFECRPPRRDLDDAQGATNSTAHEESRWKLQPSGTRD